MMHSIMSKSFLKLRFVFVCFFCFITITAVVASATSGHKDGSSGSLTLITGASKGGQGSSGSIVLNTGDASGGPAGGVKIEVGETVSFTPLINVH